MATLLASVALISLIVGGIGIANVMLLSVTERTREIRIRMAVGGRARDILFQFLTEAVVLASLRRRIGLLISARPSQWLALRCDLPTPTSPPGILGPLVLAVVS